MRVFAIQNQGSIGSATKLTKKQPTRKLLKENTPEVSKDVVMFKGKNALAGAGIGAAVGLAAITFISGGLATPIGIAMYCGATGLTGGIIGQGIDNINEKDNKK